jgi:hypothetical protein
MEELSFSEELFTALNTRLAATPFGETCTGGWSLGDVPEERPTPPYMIVLPVEEITKQYTSKRMAVDVIFACQIVTRTFASGQQVVRKCKKYITNAPLVFDSVEQVAQQMNLSAMRVINIEYNREEELDDWTATIYYKGEMSQKTIHSPE